MLMIDRVLNVSREKIVAVKAVSSCDPCFQGHFPGFPIMPGVLIVEGMAQASSILAKRRLNLDSNTNVLFLSIERAKFRKPVLPGDLLRFECAILQLRGFNFRSSCVAKVDDIVVAEAVISGATMKHGE